MKEILREGLNGYYREPSIAVIKDDPNLVVLISASGGGCGSTTLANLVNERMGGANQPVLIGKQIRELLGADTEVSAARFEDVPKVRDYDSEVYENLPTEGRLVVEGKHATVLGPGFISADRNIYPINLRVPDFISSSRVLRREGLSLADFILNPKVITDNLSMIRTRNDHIRQQTNDMDNHLMSAMRDKNVVDTSVFTPEEIVGHLFGDRSWEESAPEWEIQSLMGLLTELRRIQLDRRIPNDLKDEVHFSTNISTLEYNLKHRLPITKNAAGLVDIRSTIRNAIQGSVFSLMMKNIPRYFVRPINENDVEYAVDNESQKWTPEYYKIANAWPTLRTIIEDKSILDPFAGSGALLNVLAARGIPRKIVEADLSYPGGSSLNGTGYNYQPRFNLDMVRVLFDGLPSWYKPDEVMAESLSVTHNAAAMPFKNRQFDIIVSDPPYGENLDEGGVESFIRMLPEMMRVVREGGIFMVPASWLSKFDDGKISYDLLVDDLSGGISRKPAVIMFIHKV